VTRKRPSLEDEVVAGEQLLADLDAHVVAHQAARPFAQQGPGHIADLPGAIRFVAKMEPPSMKAKF